MAGAGMKNSSYFTAVPRPSMDQRSQGPVAQGYPTGYAPHGAPQPGYGQQSYAQPGYGQQGYTQPGFSQPLDPSELNRQFEIPTATADQMDRMSYEDVIAKTAGLFAVVLLSAAVAWFLPLLAFVGMVGSLVLSLVLAFRKTPSAPLSFAFAAAEGLLVGGFSVILENSFPGIVVQAMLATFAVIGATLVLFLFGKVRTSPRMTKIMMVAGLGYLLFSLINVGYSFLNPESGMFGMRSDVVIFGIPLGVIVGLFAVGLGAYMLVMDFEFVKNGVLNGAPRAYGWMAGYSLVATVVFIYIELLRLIAIFRSN